MTYTERLEALDRKLRLSKSWKTATLLQWIQAATVLRNLDNAAISKCGDTITIPINK